MPVISEYRVGRGCESWRQVLLEKEITKMFDHEKLLVTTTSWLPDDIRDSGIKKIEEDKTLHLLLIGMLDPWLPSDFMINHPRIHPLASKDFVFWLLMVGRHFYKYSRERILPEYPFEHNFLCYQRKVFPSRECLYDSLKGEKGIVTLSNREIPDFNKTVSQDTGVKEVFPDPEIPDELMMPNDMMSLGNLKIWQKCFLNIVSETYTGFDNTGPLFISEKTFKPIIGMRPFLIYGNSGITTILKDRGFETFEDDFGLTFSNSPHPQCHANKIKDIVKQIDKPDLLYKKLLPKIEHNKNHFDKAVANEWQRLKEKIEYIHSLL